MHYGEVERVHRSGNGQRRAGLPSLPTSHRLQHPCGARPVGMIASQVPCVGGLPPERAGVGGPERGPGGNEGEKQGVGMHTKGSGGERETSER